MIVLRIALALAMIGCVAQRTETASTEQGAVPPMASPATAAAHGEADFETWEKVRGFREVKLHRYLTILQRDNFDWFLHWYFGTKAGLPIGFVYAFEVRWPEIWHADWREQVGLPKHPRRFAFMESYRQLNTGLPTNNNIPLGFTRTPGPFKGIDVMGQTCASCHVGRVLDEKGQMHFLIGAPNSTWDPFLFKNKIKTVSIRNDFTGSNLLLTKDEREKLEFSRWQELRYQIFAALSPKILGGGLFTYIANQLRSALGRVDYLDERVYDRGKTGDTRMLGGMPGHLDITSPIIGSQMDALEKMTPAARDEVLKEILAPGPVIVDYMSVWLQGRQTHGQWDGNTPDHLLRNLGAEVAGVNDPKLVDFENGLKTTEFLRNLPPPPYIFPIDWKKRERGKEIFEETCLKCHKGNQFVPLTVVKTDPNRATGLPNKARLILAQLLLDSCTDKTHPSCRERPLDEVILDRSDNPGYMAPFLDGIWARAPYLHNGSVPTLYHMLVPDERPKRFYRGHLEYDQEKVGFRWDRREGTRGKWVREYNTSLPGYSNQGHGSDLADRQQFFGKYDFGRDVGAREALLAYLKSL